MPRVDAFLERAYLLLFALLPWSFEQRLHPLLALDFPAELLIGGIAVLLVLRHAREWAKVLGPKWLLTASSLLLFLALNGGLISLKYWIVTLAHVVVFACGSTPYRHRWPRWVHAMGISMAWCVVYTLLHHAQYGFRADQALLAPMPFFPDHNMYAAVLSGLFWLYWGVQKAQNKPSGQSYLDVVVLALLLLGLLVSSSRAAWLSFTAGCAVWAYFYLRLSAKWLFLPVFLLAALAFLGKSHIMSYLKNDVSSQERYNRYLCALRMAKERPLRGFGAGTYAFEYLRFQQEAQMTRISMREPVRERNVHTYGRGGGAHSEFLRRLAEYGWPGLLVFFGVLFGVFRGLLQDIKKTERADNQCVPLSICIACLTLALHGMVNDLFHDARVAAIVWGSLAYQFMSSSSFLRLRGASSSSSSSA